MYPVDTNIFLEVLLSQAKKEECEKLLEQIKKGKKLGVMTDFTGPFFNRGHVQL